MRSLYWTLLIGSVGWALTGVLLAQEEKSQSQTPPAAEAAADQQHADALKAAADLDRKAAQAAQEAKDLSDQSRARTRQAKELSDQAREARRKARQAARRDAPRDTAPDAKTATGASTRLRGDRDLPGFAYKSEEIKGMPVRNQDGEDIASVKELVIDGRTGAVRYVAVSFGGFLGIGDKLFAVPWNALKLELGDGDEDDFLVLNIDKDRLKEAPGFDQEEWPDFADESWSRKVEEFYRNDSPRTAEQPKDTRRE